MDAIGPEDLHIAAALASRGIFVEDNPHFRAQWEPANVPRPDNSVITMHYVNSNERAKFIRDFWE